MTYIWQIILTAVALLLVFEGILPFLSPRAWRMTMLRAMRASDRTLRIFGFSSLLVGMIIMLLVHSGII